MTLLSRREFLQLTAGGGAAIAAGLGIKKPDCLLSAPRPNEDSLPGEITLYATTCRECPAGCGMHVRHVDGRAIKVEGNPGHPVNRGGLCPRGQSAVQGLYDPDRLKQPMRRDRGSGRIVPTTWDEAIKFVAVKLPKGKVFVISDMQHGVLGEVIDRFADAFHEQGQEAADIMHLDRLWVAEPFDYESIIKAHRLLFRQGRLPRYRLESCDFILSLSADFLESWLSPVEFAWQFSQFHSPRRPEGQASFAQAKIGRFAYLGPRLSMTAANADDLLLLAPGLEGWAGLFMLEQIVQHGWAKADVAPLRAWLNDLRPRLQALFSQETNKLTELAEAFAKADASVALGGPVGGSGMPAVAAGAAAALLNWACGRFGQTVDFSVSHAFSTGNAGRRPTDFQDLADKDVVIVHQANPVYSRPGSAELLRKAGMVVRLGTMPDETAELADWVLPIDSPLESWGDYEPWSGIHSLMQPTMGRMYDTRPAGDVLLDLAARGGRPLRPGGSPPIKDFLTWLRHRWAELANKVGSKDAELFWQEGLRRGGFWQSRPPAEFKQPKLDEALGWTQLFAPPSPCGAPLPDPAQGQLHAYATSILYDGRVANRGWLQEAPDPTTTIVWQSFIDIHPDRAKALGLRDGDVVELSSQAGKLDAPVRLTRDVHVQAIAIAFGQGHTALGRNAAGVGANAFALLEDQNAQSTFAFCKIRKTGRREALLNLSPTQEQFGRELMQWEPLPALRAKSWGEGEKLILPLAEGYDPQRDLYPGRQYKKHRWAMVIDLQKCIGCGACAVACYAENNVPVVGAKRCADNREMAWLKVVPYRHERSRLLGFLPMPCQQCDAAPCEPVCPVFASVHNEEGLNAQVYNRCIGTRYCSNNCPYKVRRFEWFDPAWAKPLDWQLNPDVSVRCRGVMEKCTFCIQRIHRVERQAGKQARALKDGEVAPACVQSCPAGVFTFGDLLQQGSAVDVLTRNDPRRYHVLEELNTKPAVTYLRRIQSTDSTD